MKCIFCLLEKPTEKFTPEHVFPEAIGGSLELKDCVCKDCNSFLGSNIDAHLTDHYLIQLHRMLNRLPGKSGRIPNPLVNGVLLEEGKAPQKVKYIFDKKGNPKELYLVPSIEKAAINGGATKVSVSIDKKDIHKLPAMLRKIIKRSSSKKEINIDELLGQLKAKEIKNPKMHVNTKIDIVNYKKAILKIVYELAYYWLGVSYIEDPLARLIRNATLDKSDPSTWGEKYKIHGNIDFFDKESLVFPFGLDLTTSHIAFLLRSQNNIGCYVRIFTVFEGIITITENAQLYPNFQERFIEIKSSTRNKKECSLLHGFDYLLKSQNIST